MGKDPFDKDSSIQLGGEGAGEYGAAAFYIEFVWGLRSVCEGGEEHWGIENSLHYVLDVAFEEDDSRLRKDNGPENMAILRKLALTVARVDTESKSSIIGRRKQTAWSNEYLEWLLFQSQLASELG